MRTYKGLFPGVYDFGALYRGYRRARRGKSDRAEILRFEQNLEENLIQLQNELIWGEYRTSPYRLFCVYEPKQRLVASLPFRDRVVQHALVEQMEPIWEWRFIYHSYACRPGKGMHAGAHQAQAWLREIRRRHGRVYALKADISKYFPSIDHDVLIAQLERHVACARTLDMSREIIESWGPRGLPIGNLTSQLWANVYLHDLDMHCKQGLRLRRFMRYMDDFLVLHHDKGYLHEVRRHLTDWLRHELRLELNAKTQVFPVHRDQGRGLDYLGYRIWPDRMRLRKDSVKRMRRRLADMQRGYSQGDVSLEEIRQRIASWIGHAQHADSERIREKLLGDAVFSLETA